MEISGRCDKPVVLERAGESWQLRRAGAQGLADRRKVEGLIQSLKLLPRSAGFAGTFEGDAGSLWTEPRNARTVRLFRAGILRAAIATLEIGGSIRDRRYVRPGGANRGGSGRGPTARHARRRSALVAGGCAVPDGIVRGRLALDASGPKGPLKLIRVGGHQRIDQPFRKRRPTASKLEDLDREPSATSKSPTEPRASPANPWETAKFMVWISHPGRSDFQSERSGATQGRASEVGDRNSGGTGQGLRPACRRGPAPRGRGRRGSNRSMPTPKSFRGLRVADVVPERIDRLADRVRRDQPRTGPRPPRLEASWRRPPPCRTGRRCRRFQALMNQLGTIASVRNPHSASETGAERPLGLDPPVHGDSCLGGCGGSAPRRQPATAGRLDCGSGKSRPGTQNPLRSATRTIPGNFAAARYQLRLRPRRSRWRSGIERFLLSTSQTDDPQLAIRRDGETVELEPKGDFGNPAQWRMIAPVSAKPWIATRWRPWTSNSPRSAPK